VASRLWARRNLIDLDPIAPEPKSMESQEWLDDDSWCPVEAVRRAPFQLRQTGLVMLCDVDLDTPDATRTHTVEVARNSPLRLGCRI